MENKFTLAILVEDKPTTLTRVAGLFARRNFNIHSLTVGPTEIDNISRITIVTDEVSASINQVVSQLRRLIHILRVEIVPNDQSVNVEVCLIKISRNDGTFNSILNLINHYNAQIVNETQNTMIVQLQGSSEQISEFIESFKPFGILELVKSGVISLNKSEHTLKDQLTIGYKN